MDDPTDTEAVTSPRFLAKHSAMAYDDARTKLFWQKAKEEGATVTYLGATFPDGSDYILHF